MQDNVSLKPEEVAALLKIAKNTVYELIKRGELPAYRVGRKLRIELKDVEAYKEKQKSPGLRSMGTPETGGRPSLNPETIGKEGVKSPVEGLVICGLDIILDILARSLEKKSGGSRVLRQYAGSFAGLLALYQGTAHLAGIHLWDGETGLYNIPYVRRLMPGVSSVVVHLAMRRQGFYVVRGNPLKIRDWEDLTRPEVRFINREKGSGTRVLLDEKLCCLGIERRLIKGYGREALSHLEVASAVARGEADVALGIEKASFQARGLEFVPLQKERYELVMKKEALDQTSYLLALQTICSPEFRAELEGLGDYDLTEIGTIVAEI